MKGNSNQALVDKRALANPCLKESQVSMDCIAENNFQKEKCSKEFEAYKMCKTFWMKVRVKRQQSGLDPHLPYPEDRKAFLNKYKATGVIPETAD